MPSLRSHPSRARHGRLLVECLVAMLLLDTSALVVVALARSAARSIRTAQLTTQSWALATQGVESATASRCGSGAGAGVDVRPSIVAEWTESDRGGWREREVLVTLQHSALAGVAPTRLTLRAALGCP